MRRILRCNPIPHPVWHRATRQIVVLLELDNIFNPYFTTKEEGSGSGIGLYMSKMIVEGNLGGYLVAANTAEGVRFTIDLPAISVKP